MSSPGEIAKTINRITKLEEVDDWISTLTSNINQSNRDIIRMEGEAKTLTQEIDIYKDIDKTEKINEELKILDITIGEIQSKEIYLNDMLIELKEKTRDFTKLKEFLLSEKYILKAEKIQTEIDNYQKMKDLWEEYSSAFNFVRDTNNKRTSLIVIDGRLKDSEYSTDSFDSLKTDLSSFEDVTNKYRKLKRVLLAEDLITEADKLHSEIQLFDELNEMLKKMDSIDVNCVEIEKKITNNKNQYMDILKKINQCPTCFSPMDSKHLQKIEESL
jgi:hypothetical protein